MKNILKRLISGVLAVILMLTCLPVAAFAATSSGEDEDSAELNDGYISLSVSKDNGGFLVDTLLGNQLKDSDDEKNLLFPSEGYDSSFTSFRVTRKDGTVEDYVFGRQYGFLGLSSSDVKVEVLGGAIVSTWSVKDLTVVQTLMLVDQTNPQHGLVDISYEVTTTSDDVANVKARIMLDTALGTQDYAYYQLHNKQGGYTLIKHETVVEDPYDNILLAVTNDGSSPVSAYTVNAVVDGLELRPYQAAFGHWANLANTVFDFVPDVTRPPFNNPYDGKFLTADSAYALYYDLGTPKKDEPVLVSTYYGVYSNVSVGAEESVAINFTQLPSPMKIKDGSTLESASYHGQKVGGNDGDIEFRVAIENLSSRAIGEMTVVVKTMNNVYYYSADELMEGNYSTVVRNVYGGWQGTLDFTFHVTPLNVSEYRYFEVEVYNGTTLSEGSLLGSNGFYLLCPSVLGEEVSFNTTNPQTIYVDGSRTLYVSGQNFGLLQDTSAYNAYLRPLPVQPEGATRAGQVPTGTVIPGTNISVNQGENTMNVLVQSPLAPGVYELVLDWVEEGKEDTTSKMLLVHVSDDPTYKTPSYGVVTVERTPEYTKDNPTYRLGMYQTEQAYKDAWKNSEKNIYEEVLLEFRGSFSMAYNEQTNELEVTAVSKKNADGTISGSINISNALEVEGGYVTLRVENPGAADQCINIDIKGHVFTSGERTTVWDGVCAITPIANGEINQLVQYYEDGSVDDSIENTTALANTISLLWPSAAGTMQTICGMFFELRYCEFGTIATEYCDKNIPIPDDVDRIRVIAFSAILDPSFLLPTDFDWKGRETTTLDAVQRTVAKKNYTSEQLVDIDKRYKNDMKKWMDAQEGTLVIVVDNILFGDRRFIGFDCSLEVGIPSYFEGIGGIEGTLTLKIWLLDLADTVYMEFGVDGAIDLEIVTAEATLVLKSINGIPIPDELYLYIGGFTPGWNVDGFGVLWVTGLGGGFANLYDSIVSKSKVPAFSVSLEGGFSLFQILFARLKLTLSARGLAAELKDLGFNRNGSGSGAGFGSGIHGEADILTLIPSMGFSVYWYPKFQASAHMKVNILSIIEGGGYLVLEEDTERDRMFFEALATCKVKTPKIPLIGSITLGGVDVGVDLERVYGVLHILKLDMGVCYYYGGDVDFSFGKYDVPGPTLCSILVGELSNGEPVYMVFGTNITEVANSRNSTVTLSHGTLLSFDEPSITSASDRKHHTFSLGSYAAGDMALTVNFPAASLADARRIAMGGMFTEAMTVTDPDGNAYPLTWLDVTAEEMDPEVADSANALLNYDEETGEATVTISFTQKKDFETIWNLTSSEACELVLYSLSRLADVESVGFDGNTHTVSWTGSQLEDFDELTVAAINENGDRYSLYDTTDAAVITSGSITIEIPDYLPTGTYTVQLVAKDQESNVNDVEETSSAWSYVNPKQPGNPMVSNVRLGGDYTIDLDVAASGTVVYDGYAAIIYQYDTESGTWIESDYAEQFFAGDVTELTVGGSYISKVWLDAEGNELTYAEYMEDPEKAVSSIDREVGLQADTKYRVGVRAYAITENGEILYSEEKFTEELTMVKPDPAEVTVTGTGAKALTEKNDFNETVTRDVYTANVVTLKLTADQAASVTWELDNKVQTGTGTIAADGSLEIVLSGVDKARDLVGDNGLTQGDHVLKLHITNENGDESNQIYTFRVDSEAPVLMIASPDTGSFYDDKVTVTGTSEPGATIRVKLDGQNYLTAQADASGNFSAEVTMDPAIYQQTISVNASDAVGNTSRTYDLILVNRIVGNPAAELAIYLDGEDVTGKVIPAGTKGSLELRYVLRNAEGVVTQSVRVPHDSSQGRLTDWDVYVVEGSATIGRDNGVKLETSSDVNGMLVVTVDRQQVSAVLGGNSMLDKQRHTVMLPADPVGYTVQTDSLLKVLDGGQFTFTVTVAEGYNGDDMQVFANGVELTGENGTYQILNIRADVVITVTGVKDIAAPEAEIKEGTNGWNAFMHVITFGLFYKDTRQITITAQDSGSGIASIAYYISDTGLTEETVKALGSDDWKAYTAPFTISPEGKYVIYAKVVDNASNMTYISSDGMILKSTMPVISGVENGGTYYGEQTVSVSDPYLESVKLDGETVELTDGELTIPADNAEHTVEATDKAGNTVTVKVTVYKIYTVTFLADHQVVATVSVKHGHDLSADLFPDVPAKAGHTQTPPTWNPASLTNVTSDLTVVAVYTPDVLKILAPASQIGYTVTLSDEEVTYGQSTSFTVEVAEGYSDENMIVAVNGVAIEPVDGVYTIPAVKADCQITVSGVADKTAPKAEIKIGTNGWNAFMNTITFGLFFKDTQQAVITASDTGSGINAVSYLVSDKALTLEQLQASQWNAYSAPVTLSAEGSWIVYAKAVDNAGNVTYVNSDGLVIDASAPQIEGIQNGGTYYGDVTFVVTDDNIAKITVNGETVYDVDAAGSVLKKQITLKPAEGKQEIVITDKAGNTTVYTVTVHEKGPYTPPDTGDESGLGLWMAVLTVSLGICAGLIYWNRKKQTGETAA